MANGSGRKQDEERDQAEAGPTEFPKSARPIYVKFGTLILTVAALCYLANQCGIDPDLQSGDSDNVVYEEAGMKVPFGAGEEGLGE